MGFAALLQAVAALAAPSAAPDVPREVVRLTPREKAALVVVSGLPAPNGVAGVLVQRWSRSLPRPRDALVFVDQEGGEASAFGELPPGIGRLRASFNRAAYRLLRRSGFDGVAVTDSLSVFGSEWAVPAARLAIRAGADLILFTNGSDARHAIDALVPAARRGLLDERVARVLHLLRSFGLRRH